MGMAFVMVGLTCGEMTGASESEVYPLRCGILTTYGLEEEIFERKSLIMIDEVSTYIEWFSVEGLLVTGQPAYGYDCGGGMIGLPVTRYPWTNYIMGFEYNEWRLSIVHEYHSPKRKGSVLSGIFLEGKRRGVWSDLEVKPGRVYYLKHEADVDKWVLKDMGEYSKVRLLEILNPLNKHKTGTKGQEQKEQIK